MIKYCNIEGCNEKHRAKGLCHKHWQKQYYQDNKEHYIQYRLTHKNQKKEQGREYRQDNKEREFKRNKQWQIDNPEYMKQWREDHKKQRLQYLKDNKKQIAIKRKQWIENNKEHITEYGKYYNQTFLGKARMKASNHNRRILTKDLTISLSKRSPSPPAKIITIFFLI